MIRNLTLSKQTLNLFFHLSNECIMSKIRGFSARVFSGTTGYLIRVEGQVNCGMLQIQPTLTEKNQQSNNSTTLKLSAYPASDALPETFRDANFSKNMENENQYSVVEIFDNQGDKLETIPVTEK